MRVIHLLIAGTFLCALCRVVQAQSSQQGVAPANSDLQEQVVALRALVEQLQLRVDELEKKSHVQEATALVANPPPARTPSSPASSQQPITVQQANPVSPSSGSAGSSSSGFLHGTTINLLFDGYYAYNFNEPIGRTNLLRAYDVSSNAFSLNQAALVFENAPDPEGGKRFGLRLDFQYGQATETLQGNPANEPRPDIYRNIFQAYGTYVFPVGKGLTVDLGKFASSLGIEGNYTKDQMNYSRSFWFNFLPFYHMGVRTNYKLTDKVAFNYWVVNGTQQTEPFNSFKDQFFGLAMQPAKTLTWNVNYYLGQEHPDTIYFPNGGAPAGLPTQQGVPFEPIPNSPTGKLHIFDTYATWQVTPKLTLAGEADDVIERLYSYSYPAHTDGGAGYLQYQLTPKLAFAGRAEYLSDRGGLFSGSTQAVKETTFTTKYSLADTLLTFWEWRRDFSNRPYFYTETLDLLKKEQNTATVGLVWWFGGKQGPW